MTNELKHAFGDRNNSEFVISPEGKVIISRTWSDPDQLRSDLEKLVGKSETLTEVKYTRQQKTETTYPQGIVERVPRPEGAVPLIVKAQKSEEPHYVKLRAEGESGIIRGRGGKLHLGFYLDPIHNVHWNNLAPPLKWKITTPDGVELSSSEGAAAKIDEKADIDPREFLIDVQGRPAEPLKLTVDYFACDNDDQWCKAVSQEYLIEFQQDRDAGRVAGEKGFGRGGKGKGSTKGGAKGRPDPERMIRMMDRNNDGKLSREEVRGRMAERFTQIDADEDGLVTPEEIKAIFERR